MRSWQKRVLSSQEDIPRSNTCNESILFVSMRRRQQHREAWGPRHTLFHPHLWVLPSSALPHPGVCTCSTLGDSPSLSFTFHSTPFCLPRGHTPTRCSQSPEPSQATGPSSSAALGICFLAARGCTLIHLYHRKQKTSLTSHLFHRWESNSLLNDCPEPTIQKGRIYSAAKDRGALL